MPDKVVIYLGDKEKKAINTFYDDNTEKGKRRLAGLLAIVFGRGGDRRVTKILKCSNKTVIKGRKELDDKEAMEVEGIRKKGGGRKSLFELYPNVNEIFMEVMKLNTAGDPMGKESNWTNLTRRQISDEMAKRG